MCPSFDPSNLTCRVALRDSKAYDWMGGYYAPCFPWLTEPYRPLPYVFHQGPKVSSHQQYFVDILQIDLLSIVIKTSVELARSLDYENDIEAC